MNKHLSKIVIVLGIFVSGLVGIFHTEDAVASQVYLNVTPVSFHYTLDPGDSQSGNFLVSNKGDKTIYYEAKAVPYYATEEDGNMKVFYDQKSSHTEIADWVTFENQSGQIEPGSSAEIKFTIDVPSDAHGGGQYAALIVSNSSENPRETGGISISEVANIGPVVYAKINGDIVTKGEIISHDIQGFRFEPPISATSIVKNEGNVHAEAIYTMRVYPLFSDESIYSNEERPASITVLPGATRYYSVTWTADKGAPSIGVYKVKSEVQMFDQFSTLEKIVIICPMWVMITVGAFIVALIFWIIIRVKSRKAEIA